MLRHDFAENLLPAGRQVQMIAAPHLLAFDQALLLEPIEELTHVPLGHQQTLGKLLLREVTTSANLLNLVVLRVGHPALQKEVGSRTLDKASDTVTCTTGPVGRICCHVA